MDFSQLTDFEEMQPEFFDKKLFKKLPQQLWRVNNYAAGRYYYAINEATGKPTFYMSVTNLIQSTLPTSPFLTKWIAGLGFEEAERYKHERASYGTFMHTLFKEVAIERRVDLDRIKEQLLAYCEAEYLPRSLAVEWEHELKKDALAFAQWMQDFKVRPLMIEPVLASRDGYAGAVDFFGYITITTAGFHPTEVYASGPRKGTPRECKVEEEVLAIVDFKSGRKGFYESNEIQLEAYRHLIEENFPQVGTIKHLYNFSPKDWSGTTPTYNFKAQTYSRNLQKLPYLIQLGAIEAGKREKMTTQIGGVLSLDAGLSNNVVCLSMDDLVEARQREMAAKKKGRKPAPPMPDVTKPPKPKTPRKGKK